MLGAAVVRVAKLGAMWRDQHNSNTSFRYRPSFAGSRTHLRGDIMLTRSPTVEPKRPAPPTFISKSGNGMAQQGRSGPSESGKLSVISNDLKIVGQGLKIISQGILQVDGEVEGDVAGNEVIIGEMGKVTGTVAAERVIVRGTIAGVIRAMAVALQASARVSGDIHHMSLALEQGAEFDGRCRRPSDPNELKVDLNG
jgi:cytoskeletal protein CcmA (bactofilin family)